MQLPLCYNPNITKWPNIGTVFWATVYDWGESCLPEAPVNFFGLGFIIIIMSNQYNWYGKKKEKVFSHTTQPHHFYPFFAMHIAMSYLQIYSYLVINSRIAQVYFTFFLGKFCFAKGLCTFWENGVYATGSRTCCKWWIFFSLVQHFLISSH